MATTISIYSAFAGVSAAPANARPEVRSVVDVVAASNDDDGVAQVIDVVVRVHGTPT